MPQKGTHEIEWSLYSQNLTKRIKDQFNEELWHQSPVIMCDTCKKNKPLDQYLESFSLGDIARRSTNSMRYKQTCNECQRKILAMLKDESSTTKEAYYRWASAMNLYIDEEVISYMQYLIESDNKKFPDAYSQAINELELNHGQTFFDSPAVAGDKDSNDGFLKNKLRILNIPNSQKPSDIIKAQHASKNWDEEHKEYYDLVLEIFKMEPFADEPMETQKRLYHNLALLCSEDMEQDISKQNAAIEVVRGMQRLESLNKIRIQIENSDQVDLDQLKDIAQLQKIQSESIQKLQKEWGFNNKYSASNSAGPGSLTAIMSKMEEGFFEDALANKFDVETCEGMQQVANISWKAIFNQLNLSDAEYASVIASQNENIRNKDETIRKLKEELRQVNVELESLRMNTSSTFTSESGD